MPSINRLIIILSVLLLITSCADKSVRHLASDASLVTPGTTKEDVLTYLGDPDTQQMISEKTERWIYYEEQRSSMQKTPYVGSFFSAKGYSKIVVTFDGDKVVDCTYNSYDSGEFDWTDDYSWQEKRE